MTELAQHSRMSFKGGILRALLLPFLLLYGAWFLFEVSRPDLLIVGNITVDLVDGTTPTGGAVSYASVVAQALGASSCVVTVAGPEADIDIFQGAELYVIPANETLTFEHTYTWWGHSRRLRVTANPNITISRAHVPWRCRFARVVLLGPLTLHDVDAASFAQPDGFWEQLLNRRQLVGLMAQGFQRALGADGEVLPLPAPSVQLLGGLSKRVLLFLSDVETDTWSKQDLRRVVTSTAQVIVTEGDKGATLLVPGAASSSSSRDSMSSRTLSSSTGSSSSSTSSSSSSSSSSFQQWKIPAVKVPQAVDTNGAGDTFATMYMLALMRRDPSPGSTASWAASRAVLQPQTCKPRCAPNLITAQPGGVPAIGQLERAWLSAVPLIQHMAVVAVGPVKQLTGLVPQAAWAVEWMEEFSVSSSWGRGSRIAETAGLDTSATLQLDKHIGAGTAADKAGTHAGKATAATAVPHAGVEPHQH